MPIDQPVIARFIFDYPTKLPLTGAQRSWLMRVKAARYGGNFCATVCETANWEPCGSEVIFLCSEPWVF
jgi:hypothetical protein